MARIYTKQALLDPSMLAQDAAYRKSLADSAAQNRMRAAQAIGQGLTAFGKGAGETIGQGIGMATRYGDYQDFLKEYGDDPEAKAAAWKFMYEGDTNPMQQYIATKRAKETQLEGVKDSYQTALGKLKGEQKVLEAMKKDPLTYNQTQIQQQQNKVNDLLAETKKYGSQVGAQDDLSIYEYKEPTQAEIEQANADREKAKTEELTRQRLAKIESLAMNPSATIEELEDAAEELSQPEYKDNEKTAAVLKILRSEIGKRDKAASDERAKSNTELMKKRIENMMSWGDEERSMSKKFITPQEKRALESMVMANPDAFENANLLLEDIRNIPTESLWTADEARRIATAKKKAAEEAARQRAEAAAAAKSAAITKRGIEAGELQTKVNDAISNNTPPSQLDDATRSEVEKTKTWNRKTNSWEAK